MEQFIKQKNIDDLNEADYIMLPSYEEITTSQKKIRGVFPKTIFKYRSL